MARITTRLTDTEIKNAKPKEKEYSLNDGDGLALRIKPNGSKLWLFNYSRPVTKKRTNIGFGKYPDLSLTKARSRALAARELLADGIDPKEHRDSELKAKQAVLEHTFELVVGDWLKLKSSKVVASTFKTISSTLHNHILPVIGKYPITAITAPLVIAAIKPIEAKGTLYVVVRACQYLNQIMNYSVNHGIVLSNPLVGIREVFQTKKAVNHPHIRPEQLPELLQDIATANIKKVTRFLILWQMHTMTRPTESAWAEWSEIDYEEKVWTIPAIRMKGVNATEHKVPLTTETLAILEAIKPISGRLPYIFPADRNPNSHANSATANMALKRMGYQGIQTAHGLRGLARTILSDNDFAFEPSEACLSHKVGNAVSQSYNHSTYFEQRVKIMQWWSTHISESAMGLNNIVGFKTRKAV